MEFWFSPVKEHGQTEVGKEPGPEEWHGERDREPLGRNSLGTWDARSKLHRYKLR